MLVTLKVPEELYLQAVQWLAARTEPAADPAAQATMSALNGTNLHLSALVDQMQAQLEQADQDNWALRERIKLDAEQAKVDPTIEQADSRRYIRRRLEKAGITWEEMLRDLGTEQSYDARLDYAARRLAEAQAQPTTEVAPAEQVRQEAMAGGLWGQQFDTDDSYPDHGGADDAAAAMGLPAMTTGTLAETTRLEAMEQARQEVLGEARHEAPESPPAAPEPAVAPETPAEPEHGAHEAPEPSATPDRQAIGLKAAATVAAQTAGPVARFLEACCEDADGEQVAAPVLHAAYTEWAKRTGEPALSNIWLGKGLSANGLDRKQASRPVPGLDPKVRPIMWTGIRLKSDARKAETEAVRAAVEAAKKAQPAVEVNRDEAKLDPYITPKVVQQEKPGIVHVKTPKPPTKRTQSGVTVVRADGKVTTVQEYETADEAYREPIKPEDADGITFDIYTDCQKGTNRPYSVADDVRAMYGVETEAIEAAIRNPQRVTIRPESKDKGYPVLSFHRGDLDVITGFRTPDRPKVMAAYVFSSLANDTHRVNRSGGGGAKAGQSLPTTVKASVRALQQKGLEIPDTWESATQPIEVSYQGKVLGKMKVHLADKAQVQGDYQRLLRQAHAIDRRKEMATA